MAVTAYWYGKALINAFGGATEAETRNIDWLTDTMKVMLCTDSYTPNQDTHMFKSDITNEVSGTGYTAGGAQIANKSLSYDNQSNTIKFDGDDITWESSTISARYAVIYDDTPSGASNKPLLGYVDFGEVKSSNNGDFKIQWHVDGILKCVAT
jgi:hypothetical protein